MKIAIVTFELDGLTRNGGIGTAYRRLAELLSSEGHEVTVVFLPVDLQMGDARRRGSWNRTIRALKPRAFDVVIPADKGIRRLPGELGNLLGRSRQVFEFLRSGGFDVIHAPDNCGLVYASLEARRTGTAFADTEFVIGAHGPRVWGDRANGEVTEPARIMSCLDRWSIELADHLVSPSRYMVRYLHSEHWRLPRKVHVIPNVNRLGTWRRKVPPAARGEAPAAARGNPVIFFGRIEARKGIWLFAAALRALLKSDPSIGRERPLEVLVLGKDPTPSGQATTRLRRELSDLGSRLALKFAQDLSSEESLELLSSMPGALVCMPSLVDNSPYVVVEAIEAGFNLLGTRVGGVSELLHPVDAKTNLCEPEPGALARALRDRLAGPPVRARPSAGVAGANRAWLRLHAEIAKFLSAC